MARLTRQQHIDRHKMLHKMLDELVADYARCTGRLYSTSSIMDLLQWSHEQTTNPTEEAIGERENRNNQN
jgi:hypothetical protein